MTWKAIFKLECSKSLEFSLNHGSTERGGCWPLDYGSLFFLLTPGCILNHEMSLVHMCESPEAACLSSVQVPYRPACRGAGVGGVTSNDVVNS